MKSKKNFALTALIIVMSFSATAGADNKPDFYVALSSVSEGLATETFVVDQYLETRCGRPQSIEHLKTIAGKNFMPVFHALRVGNINELKTKLASLPCDQRQ